MSKAKMAWDIAMMRAVAKLETAVMDMMDPGKDMVVAKKKHGEARSEIMGLMGSQWVTVSEKFEIDDGAGGTVRD